MVKGSRKKLMKKVNNFYSDENLAKYSWFNLGGSAEFFYRPDTPIELSSFLKKNTKQIHIIGAGSNTLIRDGGVKGVTIKLSSKFSFIKLLSNDTFQVGAATLDKKISDFATEKSLSGFEFLSCIPGSIGGGIRMNSGCYDNNISQILISVEVMDLSGNIKNISREEIKFHYRGCDLKNNLIILSANFKGKLSDKEKIKKKQLNLIELKKSSQPSRIKTCGSTFKNTDKKKAWELIKEANCENMSVGGAKISKQHCNFFLSNGKATSLEIEGLINKVKKKVFEKTGVNLDLELQIIGENKA